LSLGEAKVMMGVMFGDAAAGDGFQFVVFGRGVDD
jgi:hypothetical protein